MDNLNTEALLARMKEICNLVPVAEIEYIINCILVNDDKMTREEAYTPEHINKAGTAFLQSRLINQVCHCCGKNARQGFRKVIPEDYPYLAECSKCKMTYYCSKSCQEKDWPVHKTWCCNPASSRDLGVNKTVMINTKTGEII